MSQDSSTESGVPRLFLRQRLLLDLLNALGSSIGNLDLQKLLFLYCQELGSRSPYEFVPYRYGAFSFTCYADRRKLVDRGLIVECANRWEITETGKRITSRRSHHLRIADFLQRHNRRGDALVTETYRQFPYYAIRSEIANELLRNDQATLERIKAARPTTASGALFTIGYEGRTIENYLNLLLKTGVTLLCDVRRNALSRKYGFSKSTLANACDRVGIRYKHLPELGISSGKRSRLATLADYRRLLSRYRQRQLPGLHPTLMTIRKWAGSGERVALTCYERDAEYCHRSSVAAEIEQYTDVPLPVNHL